LKERRALVAELDRALVFDDQFDDSNLELKRLSRYEATLHTRLRWFINLMHDPSPYVKINRDLKPNWVERVEPDLNADAIPELPDYEPIHLPSDLEPHECPEPGQKADIPRITAARTQKKIRKAQARRDVKRRKVEKLRA
jgi:hypothetical protein